jgi:hypothetical protein
MAPFSIFDEPGEILSLDMNTSPDGANGNSLLNNSLCGYLLPKNSRFACPTETPLHLVWTLYSGDAPEQFRYRISGREVLSMELFCGGKPQK